MLECYLFSQFACTTVCGTPSEILCALHHLTAEKGAASPVPRTLRRPAGFRHRKAQRLLSFLFFYNAEK